tara:strand:+ start:441 stop:3074 length:2634 start_codon:yes stop_codon:yes gene_type:complete
MDNAAEMSSEEVYEFCRFNGVHIQRCTPYEHHQNGKAERAVRTVEECALTMLHHAKLSVPLFINYALANAVQLRNKCPTRASKQALSTPYEMFTGRRPTIQDCHPIGEVCYAYIRKEQRKLKYDPKARKCIYLCEDYERKAHLLMDVQSRAVLSSRDVRFPRIGASVILPSPISPLASAHHHPSDSDEEFAIRPTVNEESRSIRGNALNSPEEGDKSNLEYSDDSDKSADAVHKSSESNVSITELASSLAKNFPSSSATTSAPPTPLLHASDSENYNSLQRIDPDVTLAPVGQCYADPVGPAASRSGPDLPSLQVVPNECSAPEVGGGPPQSDKRGSRKKNSRYFNSDFTVYSVVVCGIPTPVSYRQAMSSPQKSKWQQAVNEELDSLHRQATWDLVPRVSNMFVIQVKWVFKIKTDENGVISRYKARLVAKGFTQTEGVDYDETYSPVLQTSSRRFIYALSAAAGMKSVQADVETAFLQSEMDKVVFLEPPPGLDVPAGNVLLLRKAIYGLKQSPLLWFCTARKFFLELGFGQCVSDPCLFMLQNTLGSLILSIYVDDITLTSFSDELIQWVLAATKRRFPIRDVKPLSWLVGLRIESREGVTYVSQSSYIESLLNRYDVDRRKISSTPMSVDISGLESVSDGPMCERRLYQELVGCLNYLAHTSRPDILFAVNTLSRFLILPRRAHFEAAVRVLWYLNGTISLSIPYHDPGVTLKGILRKGLYGFCDTSYPSKDSPDGLPTSGYAIFYFRNLLSYKSNRENIVCLSTMEAELLAMTNAVTALQHVQGLLTELGYVENVITIITDSVPAVKYLRAEMYSSNPRTRHLAVRFHFLRSMLREGTLQIEAVPSKEQWADILTKALPRPAFEALKLNLIR